MSNPKGKNAIVLFDGVCNLCNTTVQFIIDHDPNHYFRFASLQSDVGKALLQEYALPANYLKSIVLLENTRCYTKSTAVLKIAKNLSGYWHILYILIIIPKFIRDFFYQLVASNRYQWFGKNRECRLMTKNLQKLFLDNPNNI